MEPSGHFEDLVAIMDRLRDPGGCPWDREQTYDTLRGFLLEECYEVAEAIDREDREGLREELGDLLFQIVFLSRLGKEEGRFDAGDVVQGIATKMIRRHPHVFGADRAETSDQVLRRWEEIKRAEKPQAPGTRETSILEGIPRALPALLKAQRLGDKAARVGFDWSHPTAVLDKVDEEIRELRVALDAGDIDGARDELGDALFALAMLGRKAGIDPEGALEGANRKFRERFQHVERELRRAGIPLESAGLARMEQLWEDAKRRGGGP